MKFFCNLVDHRHFCAKPPKQNDCIYEVTMKPLSQLIIYFHFNWLYKYTSKHKITINIFLTFRLILNNLSHRFKWHPTYFTSKLYNPIQESLSKLIFLQLMFESESSIFPLKFCAFLFLCFT